MSEGLIGMLIILLALVVTIVLVVLIVRIILKAKPMGEFENPAVIVQFREGLPPMTNLGAITGKLGFSSKFKKLQLFLVLPCILLMIIFWVMTEGLTSLKSILVVLVFVYAFIRMLLAMRYCLKIHENGMEVQLAFTKKTYYFYEIARMVPVYKQQEIASTSIPMFTGAIGNETVPALAKTMDKNDDLSKQLSYRLYLRDGRVEDLHTVLVDGLENIPEYLHLDTNPSIESYELVPFTYFRN